MDWGWKMTWGTFFIVKIEDLENPVPGTDGSPRQCPYHSRPLDKFAVWRGAGNISTINTEDV